MTDEITKLLNTCFFSFIYTDSHSRLQLPFSSSHPLSIFSLMYAFSSSSPVSAHLPSCSHSSLPVFLSPDVLLSLFRSQKQACEEKRNSLSSSCQLARSVVFSVASGCNNTGLMQQSAAFCILSNITDATRWGAPVWLLSVCSVCKVGCVLEKQRGSKGRERRGKGGREEKQ